MISSKEGRVMEVTHPSLLLSPTTPAWRNGITPHTKDNKKKASPLRSTSFYCRTLFTPLYHSLIFVFLIMKHVLFSILAPLHFAVRKGNFHQQFTGVKHNVFLVFEKGVKDSLKGGREGGCWVGLEKKAQHRFA
ncbi:hypothetical protein IE53DRAFT_249219 [Violaceomyces palustris]|uniref:Uncharacterized protein n=1 Tax=Violaceomyces palustris TaxID=1673888 RepID=A0ACD0NNU8_9BASI|nr:hypothetical protein IE53DRAFT_249219 [Violaceomyces palustris]